MGFTLQTQDTVHIEKEKDEMRAKMKFPMLLVVCFALMGCLFMMSLSVEPATAMVPARITLTPQPAGSGILIICKYADLQSPEIPPFPAQNWLMTTTYKITSTTVLTAERTDSGGCLSHEVPLQVTIYVTENNNTGWEPELGITTTVIFTQPDQVKVVRFKNKELRPLPPKFYIVFVPLINTEPPPPDATPTPTPEPEPCTEIVMEFRHKIRGQVEQVKYVPFTVDQAPVLSLWPLLYILNPVYIETIPNSTLEEVVLGKDEEYQRLTKGPSWVLSSEEYPAGIKGEYPMEIGHLYIFKAQYSFVENGKKRDCLMAVEFQYDPPDVSAQSVIMTDAVTAPTRWITNVP